MTLHCRTASLPEVRLMLDWAAAEGWNPGHDDAAAFHAADPGGFFVAEWQGALAAAISVVNHSDDLAFLGLYLCRPELRGRGIGYALWSHALDHAGARVVGLDGVPAQQANYAKSGFRRSGQTHRLTGTLPAASPALPLARPPDAEALCALDRAACGYDRRRFLTAWTRPEPRRKTVLLRSGAEISGFATARLCRDGCKIGPVVAPSAEAALQLATQAAAALGARAVSVDVPRLDRGFGKRLQALGFVESFTTARMYRGSAAPVTGPELQAIATMELG